MSDTIHLDRPQDEVFAALVEPQRLAAWNHAFDSAERLDAGPLEVGSRLRLASRVDGRPAELDVQVVGIQAPVRLELEARSDEVRSRTTLTVRTVDAGSEVTATSGALVDEPERGVDPAGNPAFAELGARLLEGLRVALDDGAVPPR